MYKKLCDLINNSYSNISGYKVACIVKMKDGKYFNGVNVENASFKDGLCAEQVAIGSAITEGYTKDSFDKLYLLGSSKHPITPCFLCRQLLVEFFSKDAEIITYDQTGEYTKYKIKDLCPYSFKSGDLYDK